LWIRVFLNAGAGAGGFSVPLASSNTNVTVPASVTFSQGGSWYDVQATTAAVTQDTPVTITVGQGAGAKTATVTIQPVRPASVSINPQSLTGGSSASGSVTLNGVAPSGGLVVPLSSSIAAATVPASVTVPAGQSSATFQLTTTTVTADTSGTITAGTGSNAKTTSIVVRRP
jgi:hypothetical protein